MLFTTGLTGLVGQALIEIAARDGIPLKGLTRQGEAQRRASLRGQDAGVEWVVGDLSDKTALVSALEGASAVLHMAAQTGAASDAEFQESNVTGTQRLLEAAREAGVTRFVFVSSIAVNFGNLASYPYARTKKEAEAAVAASGLDWLIVRPTLVLGPGAPNLEKLAGLASLPVVPQLGGGRVRLQPVDSRDLAGLLLAAVEKGPRLETLEVGGPEVVTMKAFLAQIRATRGKGGAPSIPIPIFPVRLAAKVLGALLGDRAPVKAAQLSSFTEDAVARPHPFVEAHMDSFHSLSDTLSHGLSS